MGGSCVDPVRLQLAGVERNRGAPGPSESHRLSRRGTRTDTDCPRSPAGPPTGRRSSPSGRRQHPEFWRRAPPPRRGARADARAGRGAGRSSGRCGCPPHINRRFRPRPLPHRHRGTVARPGGRPRRRAVGQALTVRWATGRSTGSAAPLPEAVDGPRRRRRGAAGRAPPRRPRARRRPCLTGRPRGYPADHPRIGLLRLRGLQVDRARPAGRGSAPRSRWSGSAGLAGGRLLATGWTRTWAAGQTGGRSAPACRRVRRRPVRGWVTGRRAPGHRSLGITGHGKTHSGLPCVVTSVWVLSRWRVRGRTREHE